MSEIYHLVEANQGLLVAIADTAANLVARDVFFTAGGPSLDEVIITTGGVHGSLEYDEFLSQLDVSAEGYEQARDEAEKRDQIHLDEAQSEVRLLEMSSQLLNIDEATRLAMPLPYDAAEHARSQYVDGNTEQPILSTVSVNSIRKKEITICKSAVLSRYTVGDNDYIDDSISIYSDRNSRVFYTRQDVRTGYESRALVLSDDLGLQAEYAEAVAAETPHRRESAKKMLITLVSPTLDGEQLDKFIESLDRDIVTNKDKQDLIRATGANVPTMEKLEESLELLRSLL
jgi:hypothetical protein